VVAFVEGELHLVIDAIVSYPIYFLLLLALLSFDLFLLCFKGRVEGHFPDLETRGDNVIHKHFTEMRRLARDETPFLLAMPPRARVFGDQIGGSVIPLLAHGHNRSARDETSYPPTNTLSVYLSHRFPFLNENLFTAFSGIPGRSISKGKINGHQ